jgi:acetylornithine deacetylase/succinyl-diaminopimelate desuccinylase-like protein
MTAAGTLPNTAARVALLARYMRIRTQSRAFGQDVVDEVRAFWRDALGLDLHPLAAADGTGAPALFTEIRGRQPGPTVLLYGHYDVQPPGDLAAWRWQEQPLDPWQPRLFVRGEEVAPEALVDADADEALLFGRGGADNKGQHLANVLGVLELAARGNLRGTVKVLLDGEEEHGSPSLAAICTENAALLKADLLLGSDGPKTGGAPTVMLGCRGLLGVEIRVENGRGASLHSGNYGNLAPNPVYALAELLIGLPARVRAVAERHGDYRHTALAAFGDAPSRPAWEPFLLPTTNVNGLLSEGATPGAMRTIIPAWAAATIDVRLTPDTPHAEVLAALEEVVAVEQARAAKGVRFTLRRTALVPPSYTAPDRPEIAAIAGAGRDFWGVEPAVMPILGGTLPNYVFTDLLAMPAIWLPGAQPDNHQHDVNERLAIDHFLRQSGWYAAALSAVASLRAL